MKWELCKSYLCLLCQLCVVLRLQLWIYAQRNILNLKIELAMGIYVIVRQLTVGVLLVYKIQEYFHAFRKYNENLQRGA
jgi:hypothetical protein